MNRERVEAERLISEIERLRGDAEVQQADAVSALLAQGDAARQVEAERDAALAEVERLTLAHKAVWGLAHDHNKAKLAVTAERDAALAVIAKVRICCVASPDLDNVPALTTIWNIIEGAVPAGEPAECEREDCQQIAATACDVYCAITGGLLSYPTYDARTILAFYENDISRQIDDAVWDAHKEAAAGGPRIEVLRAERDLARSVAVALEQELAAAKKGLIEL